jgi:hypothetical protein
MGSTHKKGGREAALEFGWGVAPLGARRIAAR